jgi:hypothetical protein
MPPAYKTTRHDQPEHIPFTFWRFLVQLVYMLWVLRWEFYNIAIDNIHYDLRQDPIEVKVIKNIYFYVKDRVTKLYDSFTN